MPIRWSAHEHGLRERDRSWYVALGIAAVCFATIAVILGNVLFGVLILLAALTLALLARHPPKLAEFEISDLGVTIDNELHRYEEIISFWVEEKHEPPMLFIDTVKPLSPNFIVPLEHVDPKLVRAYLVERAEEVPMRESLSHRILAFFGI